MSEHILKALMQLFAIIAMPENIETISSLIEKDDKPDDIADYIKKHAGEGLKTRRAVVRTFLLRHLNEEQIDLYLDYFDKYLDEILQKSWSNLTKKKKLSMTQTGDALKGFLNLRIMSICQQISGDIDEKQKIIILYQFLEYIQMGGEIHKEELEYVETVVDGFAINNNDYNEIREFVLAPFDTHPDTENLLVINNKEFKHDHIKHLHRKLSDNEEICILNLSKANLFLIKYFGSDEVYLNGQIILPEKVYVLDTGVSIRCSKILPVYMSDINTCFYKDKIKSKIYFEARNLKHWFSDGNKGISDVNFITESGNLIGIMGASGAGKTTLLYALNGTSQPSDGQILINGYDIYKEKEHTEGVIGHVSQDDLLIEELTVFQNLYYNAKLCFDNYTEEKIVETVNFTLENLGLYAIKDIQVGSPLNKKISGGQRKRLNISLELIREPSILFLDEPTSGLSSRDSENIMDLLKELTLKGKLIFVVIHQPSSDIFKMFDQLIILDTGGYLIYNGNPVEAIEYFKVQMQFANAESECLSCRNVNPEQIFNIIESKVLDEYGKLTRERKVKPEQWSKTYKEDLKRKEERFKMAIPEKMPEIPPISFKIPNKIKQFFVLVKRDILSKLSNTQYLVINFLEAPLLAFILAFIIKYFNISESAIKTYTLENNSNLPVYIFMSVIVAVFMGLTVSAEEIIKDRKILKREAFLNLSWGSYLASKVSIMFVISALQALLFVIVGNSIMEIHAMYWQYWLVLFSVWASANILGLIISDSFKTVVTIYILVPFLVIPQILLSGVIVKYDKLNPHISSPINIPFYGEIITARWGYEALAVYQFMENKYEKKLYKFDKIMSKCDYIRNYWIPVLDNKIVIIEENLNKDKEKAEKALTVLKNEIQKENKAQRNNKKLLLPDINIITIEDIDEDVIVDFKDHLAKLRKFYTRLYNMYNGERNKIISSMQTTDEDKKNFMSMKEKNYNEKLAEFLEDKNETIRTIEYKGRIYQKTDPIYMDPESKYLKAHFYAPVKYLSDIKISTFWANIIVLWITSIVLCFVLYYRLLKKSLDFMENMTEKLSKSKE